MKIKKRTEKTAMSLPGTIQATIHGARIMEGWEVEINLGAKIVRPEIAEGTFAMLDINAMVFAHHPPTGEAQDLAGTDTAGPAVELCPLIPFRILRGVKIPVEIFGGFDVCPEYFFGEALTKVSRMDIWYRDETRDAEFVLTLPDKVLCAATVDMRGQIDLWLDPRRSRDDDFES